MTEKVLLLLKDLDSQKDLIKADADFLSQWSNQVTQGEFSWSFDIEKTDANFSTISSTVTSGVNNAQVPGKYLDPKQIVAAASGQQCDVVALLYSNLTYKDTISVHTSILVNGVRCVQLPISLQANKEGIAENLAHELLHEDIFTANQRGANLIDDVHQHSGLTDPRPEANYSDILLKLKPYWPLLTQPDKSKLITLINSLKQQVVVLLQKLSLMPQTKLKQFAEAIQLHEGYYKGSRSYRNNNPGNLRYTTYTASLGATGKDSGNFCIFASYNAGFGALQTFLKHACTNKLKAYKGTMSLNQFFETYAPTADKNNPHRYAQFVATYLNVPVETQISSLV